MAESLTDQRRPRPSRVPAGRRIYAIGDIHGRIDLLTRIQAMIAADAARAAPAANAQIYLGDLVDRGPDSRGAIERLAGHPHAGFEAVYLLGNHEAMMLQFLDDVRVGPTWLFNGGDATLASYGVVADFHVGDAAALRRAQAELRQRLPAGHLAFLRAMRLWHVEGDYLFVHAGIRPGVALAQQRRGDLIWIRDEFLASDADHGQVVVHGHSITRAVDVRPNRIGIDTGAFYSGRLTCLVLEGAERRLLQT